MKRYRVLTLAGVPVTCHEALLWFLGLFLLWLFAACGDVLVALRLAGSLLVGLAALLVHEAGHALAAKRLGVPVNDILLHALGGLTRMAPPRSPREEFLIGAAGPLANLAAAAALWPAHAGGIAAISFDPRAPLEVAFAVNLLLGGLNLVPAFPMDGGRILRAALSLPLGAARATLVALVLGRFLALAMVGAPLALGPEGPGLILPVIGIVLLVLGENEARRSAMREEELRVGRMLGQAVRPPDAGTPPDGGAGPVPAPEPAARGPAPPG